MNMKEIKEKRTLNRKVFEAEDGSGFVEISSSPLHCVKNGKLEEIDTSIRKAKDGYCGESGDYKVQLISGNNTGGTVSCTFKDKSVTWELAGEAGKPESVTLPDGRSYLRYSGENSDLDYELEACRLKERIVIKKPLGKYEYVFSMTASGVSPVSEENGDISFKDDEGKDIFRIPKGYMYDGTGKRSDDVKFSIDERNGNYLFTVIPDADWINNEETVFPVVIDPEMYFSEMLNTGISYVNTRPGRDGPYTEYSTIGEQQIVYVSNIFMDISGLPDNAVITGATLNLKQLSDHAPGFIWLLEDNYSGILAAFDETGPSGHVFPVDVTLPVMIAAQNGRSNCSLILYPLSGVISYTENECPDCEIPEDQNVPGQGYVEFDGLQSTLIINYVSRETYRDHRPVISLRTGQGVDLSTGEMTFSVTDVPTNSPALPLSVCHYYSSFDGWRTNLDQSVRTFPYGSSYEAEYTASDGKKHFFTYIDGVLTDVGGLEMRFSYTQNGYRITDKGGGILEFDGSGKLVKILDKNGNYATVSRNNNGKVSYLTDSFGRQIHFMYSPGTGKLSSLSDPAGRYTVFSYSGDDLSSVTYPDGMSVSFAYSDGKLSRITNPDGTKTGFIYSSDKLCKAESLPSDSNIAEDFVRIVYNSNNSVEIKDRTGLAKVYVLDADGRPICEYEKKYDEDMRPQHKLPSGTVLFNYTGTKRTFSSSLAAVGYNHIVNGEFSGDNEEPWELFGTRLSSDGIRCCSYAINGIPGSDKYIRQTIDGDDIELPYGDTMILSAWAKASAAAHGVFCLRSEVWYTDGSHTDNDTSFDRNYTDWQYAAVPVKIDRTKTIECVNVFLEYSKTGGICLFDNVRLVCAPAAEAEYEKDLSEYLTIFGTSRAVAERVTTSNGIYTTVEEKNENGDVIRQTVTDLDGNDFISLFEYDSCRRLVKTQNERNIITEYTYNSVGMVTSTKTYYCYTFNPSYDPEPEEYFLNTTEYDQTGEFAVGVGDSRSDSIKTLNTFNTTKGILTATTAPNGQTVSYSHNSNNDLVTAVTSTLGNDVFSVLYGYDSARRVTSVTHNGFVYGFTYDTFGRQKEFSIAGTTFCENSYELTDRTVVTKDFASGESVTLETDRNSQPVKSTYADSDDEDTVISEGEYDDLGNPVSLIDRLTDTEYTYEYDTYGNVIREKRNNTTYKYSNYDSHCRLISTSKSNETYIPSYDSKAGIIYPDTRVTGMALTGKYTDRIILDNYGRTTAGEVTLASAQSPIIRNEIEYISVSDGDETRLTGYPESFRTLVNGTETSKYSYTYDNNGNITGVYSSGYLVIRYVYDGANRLIREDNSILNATYTYSYDTAGNILEKKKYPYSTSALVTPIETKTYTYASTGWKDRLISFGGSSISYDVLGNPTSYRGHSLSWGMVRQLDAFDQNTFEYNASGIRVRKNGTTYELDGTTIVRESRAGTVISYHHGISGLVGFTLNGTDYYYNKDLFGNIVGIYGSGGTKFAEYEYDAWGNHTVTLDVNGIGSINPFRYRGYYFDSETGLYYVKCRYYDPTVGRWISPEPNVDSGAFDSGAGLAEYNLYTYCANSPIGLSDPTGEFALTSLLVGVIIGVVVGAVVGGVAGGVIAYEAAEESGLEGEDLFWATAAGVGEGALIGGVIGGLVGATGGTAAAYGGSSVAAVATYTATVNVIAKTANIATLQARKSTDDGDSGWELLKDCIDVIFCNGLKITVKPVALKGLTTEATSVLKHSVYSTWSDFLKSTYTGGWSYLFSAFALCDTIDSLACPDPIVKANDLLHGYGLK